MHQNICDEYLGDIDAKQLSTMMLSLTNINKYVSSIPEIVGGAILEADKPLMVSADYEYTYDGDPMTTKPTGRRFVGLHIEPHHD
jgi:hypothetical protein